MDFLKSTALELLSSFWVIQSACALLLLRLSQRLYLAQRRKLDEGMERTETKRVALVIPVKGLSPNFPRFMDFALGQDYPDYRVIFAVESEDDPAHAAILRKIHGNDRARIIVAGAATDSGQKVHNQLAAFRQLGAGDRIIAFADGDLVAGENWLSHLVFPINRGHADLTTGYRWFVPESGSLPNKVITLIGTGIEPLLGPGWRMCLWGGSMAVSRETFDELEIPRNLQGSVNDDLRITQLAKRAGKRMRYTRTVAALTPVDFTWAGLFEFGRRQYFQVRIYQPSLWLRALLFPLLHLVSFSVCLLRLIQGNGWMLGYLVAAIILKAAITTLRLAYLKERFPKGEAAAIGAAVKSGWRMDALVNATHLAMVVAAACGRHITWAGIRYKVTGTQRTTIIRAPE